MMVVFRLGARQVLKAFLVALVVMSVCLLEVRVVVSVVSRRHEHLGRDLLVIVSGRHVCATDCRL